MLDESGEVELSVHDIPDAEGSEEKKTEDLLIN